MNVLVFNAGSSSLKFAGFGLTARKGDGPPEETLLFRGQVERVGSEQARLNFTTPPAPKPLPLNAPTLPAAVAQVIELTSRGRAGQQAGATFDFEPVAFDAMDCRVVHGGAQFTTATPVTPAVLAGIRGLSRLAPLHNPLDAGVLESAMHALPGLPAVAVFDTAFHHNLPPVAATYALPLDLSRQHDLRRYGFHGISHRYVSERLLHCLGRDAPGTRLITCHLGSGASVCALCDGQSVDTSMGLTPLEGLVMGTRSGDLDPGLVLYLQRAAGMSPEDVDDLLNHKSGLLGLSGRSGDARDLESAAAQGDAASRLALEIFAYRVCKYIGAYAVVLEGLDALAFTGGLGEHDAPMRLRVCRRLDFLGLHGDEEANRQAGSATETRISADASPIQAWVIPTDEERQIAREVFALLA